MKIPPQKTKETEEPYYKNTYGKFVKVGVIKTKENDNTRERRLGK
jgi:hypothetical protein